MSNRRRADNLPILLAQVGLRMAPSRTPVPFELSPDEIELLAQLEHRRWVIDRRLLGVSYGDVRSDFPPRHELLVDWEHLPEIEREKNRTDFRNLPKVLAEAGFEVQREDKILALESTLETALSRLELATASEGKNYVIVADEMCIRDSSSTCHNYYDHGWPSWTSFRCRGLARLTIFPRFHRKAE